MRSAWILLLGTVMTQAAAAQSSPPDSLRVVPVSKEPLHHVVFENALVRILDVRVSPGEMPLYHIHANRHVVVVIEGARTIEQIYGQPPMPADSVRDEAGVIFDNWSRKLPYTHREWDADTVPFHYLVPQFLRSSGVDAPVLSATSGLHLERETAGARVYVATLAPGQSLESHIHVQPGLTVQVGPGSIRLAGNAAQSASPQRGAGVWWWRAPGTRHSIRNTGKVPVEIVEIDWR